MRHWKNWWQRNKHFLLDRRSAERKAIGTPAEISWTDDSGTHCVVAGVCIDLSSGGVGIVSSKPAPVERIVNVKLQSHVGLKVTSVKHCQHVGDAYLIGMKVY